MIRGSAFYTMVLLYMVQNIHIAKLTHKIQLDTFFNSIYFSKPSKKLETAASLGVLVADGGSLALLLGGGVCKPGTDAREARNSSNHASSPAAVVALFVGDFPASAFFSGGKTFHTESVEALQ